MLTWSDPFNKGKVGITRATVDLVMQQWPLLCQLEIGRGAAVCISDHSSGGRRGCNTKRFEHLSSGTECYVKNPTPAAPSSLIKS